jgi:hypothetical protein
MCPVLLLVLKRVFLIKKKKSDFKTQLIKQDFKKTQFDLKIMHF